ncbi:MAG TPA: pilus (MSHA type) biogenesis protein MshL [Noviherbaspirillum sp.]|nr:pilus (MSHA type) biogenesis protein MshL [Noviherbaspirillum sp.]
MKKTVLALLMIGLAGCSTPSKRQTYDLINAEMNKAAEETKKPAVVPDAVSAALLPPLQNTQPPVRKPTEERFNVTFNNVPASQFFTAIAAGTRYNVLVHPDVAGTISANLKDVTLFEALDAIRELYGYDYTVEGNRIMIKPLTLQTRVYQVNYLTGNRLGSSETRVNAGSLSAGLPATTTSSPTTTTTSTSPTTARVTDSSKVSSTSSSDFWGELKTSLQAIVGTDKDGRSVVVSPQSGVVVVRAMPEELRNVSAYLKAAQISVDRQVILEAKILEVQLNDSYQAGINWASFANIMGINNNRVAGGFLAPGTSLSSAAQSNNLTTTLSTTNPVTGAMGNTTVNATTSLALNAAGNAAGSLFSFAFQTNNFAAMLSFLETQGTVHVLSSPRIATLNNQKAILKVGTDDFFVTNVSTTTNTSAGGNTTTPSVTLQPFFSGVVLDVTPQIDEQNNIILHVHPSVSQVTTVNKLVDLGTLGSLNLPLASSNASETDSVVRGQDGQIIAIGGLMRQASTSDRSQVPGAGDVPGLGALFRSSNQVTQKRELVILIKPTIVQGASSWGRDILESQQRIQALEPKSRVGLR